MQNVVRTTVALCLLISFSSTFANEVADAAPEVDAGFTDQERQLIKVYVGVQTDKLSRPGIVFNKATLKKKQEKGLPPGLVEKKSLPVGVAAQLQRDRTLPSGLTKSKLPPYLDLQLSPLQEGYERVMLDDLTIVLLETATNRIADVVLAAGTKVEPATQE